MTEVFPMSHNPRTALGLAAKKARPFPPIYNEERRLLTQRMRQTVEAADRGDGPNADSRLETVAPAPLPTGTRPRHGERSSWRSALASSSRVPAFQSRRR